MTIADAPLEGQPDDDQKHRLEDWLSELQLICRKYSLVLNTEDGETRVIDMGRGTIVGMGLAYLVSDRRITAYDCDASILDGVWPVDTPHGPQEQRQLGTVWPGRSDPHT